MSKNTHQELLKTELIINQNIGSEMVNIQTRTIKKTKSPYF